MSDPARKFIIKSEEPLMKAQAGAYALVMAVQDMDDDDERRAIHHLAWGTCPDEFLLDCKECSWVSCEVMWRRNDLIGVRFV